jgi:hypothetical protein
MRWRQSPRHHLVCQRRGYTLAFRRSGDALLSEAQTRAELSLSHSPGLGGGEMHVLEGRADAGTSSDGGYTSGMEPCMGLESVIAIGRAHSRRPELAVTRDGPGLAQWYDLAKVTTGGKAGGIVT